MSHFSATVDVAPCNVPHNFQKTWTPLQCVEGGMGDPGQFRVLHTERRFYAFSLQLLPGCGFGLQWLMLFVSCFDLG